MLTVEVKPKDFPTLPDTPSPSPPLPASPPLRRDMYHLSMAVRSHQVTEDVYML
jgi:hypothetical protein